VRREIIKCQDSRLRAASVEDVEKAFQTEVADLITDMETSATPSPDKVGN
jgi:hypothetical protein